MGGRHSRGRGSNAPPPQPCTGNFFRYISTRNNLSSAANTANASLDSVTQSIDDYNGVVKTLYTQIQKIEYWYYTTIPDFIGSSNEATEEETRLKSEELDNAYHDLENSRTVYKQQKKYLTELQKNTENIQTDIQKNAETLDSAASNILDSSKSLNTVLESIYNSISGQNSLLDTTNRTNEQTYSTDGSKVAYKTDSFQLLHILQFVFLIVYYFLFCIILYYFYSININLYAKIAILLILFFYPFYIYNVQYYIYFIGYTISAYLLPNVLTE